MAGSLCRTVFSSTLLGIVLVAVSTIQAGEGEKYDLKYQFTANQFVNYQVEHQMAIRTKLNDVEETAKNASRTAKHFRVVSITPEGDGVLELVIDRVQMTAQFDNHPTVEFDSGDPSKHPKQFAGILNSVGKPVMRMTISPIGVVKDVMDLTDDVKTVSASSAVEPSENQNILIRLPEEPVSIGGEWKSELTATVKVGRTLEKQIPLRRLYKLEKVEGNFAIISFKTAPLVAVNDPELRAQLIQRMPSATVQFDMDRGLISQIEVKVDKTEVGVFGANSSMRAISTRTERLVEKQVRATAPTPN